MKTSVAALLLLVCAVSGQIWGNTGSSDMARQFQSQDGFGQAKFGYSHPGQSAETHRDARGHQVGSYAYISPEGREIRVNYIADENGYRVDNDYTQETPEVAAARSAHLAAHAAALAAARAASPNQEQWVAPQPKKSVPAPVPVQQQTAWIAPPTTNWNTVQAQPGLPQAVQDTPEVAAAKAEFFQTFRVAAARVPKEENVIVPVKKAWTAPVTNWVAPAAQKSWVAPTPTWASAQPVPYGPPQPVQDTPEVQAARNAFFASFREAAARVPQQQNVVVPQQKSWVAPQQKSWTGSYQPVVVDQYGLPQQVQETPDVAAARAEFFRSFNAAAAAAAAAKKDTTSSF